MSTYYYSYRGGEMELEISAKNEKEAKAKLDKWLSSEETVKDQHGDTLFVTLHYTHKDMWVLDSVEDDKEDE
jgi:hypothetical protein